MPITWLGITSTKPDIKVAALVDKSPFQLQITASVRERTLLATWATMTAPMLPAMAVREPTLFSVTEKG